MSTRYGTCNFVSYQAAFRYYSDYHYPNTAKALDRMLQEGEIRIGPPTAKPGERVIIINGGTR